MEKYRILGLMSGTSIDGVDLAVVDLRKGQSWSYEVLAAETASYDQAWVQRLEGAVGLEAAELLELHNRYGHWLGEMARDFLDRHALAVDFIASHGHTVFHQIDRGFTFQMGAGDQLALAAGIKVVADFRSLDVTLGGEGAPLVPIADELLFSQYDFCLNLGGIANVSYKQDDVRKAFDIGLSNMLLNHLTRREGMSYDAGGALTRSGTMSQPFFDALNELPYFSLPAPKSTGYEWFSEEVLPIARAFDHLALPDALCSVVHHVSFQVAEAVKNVSSSGLLLVTGGGAKNDFMVELIGHYAGGGIEVSVPEETIVDFKEAVAFALMGALRVRQEVNCYASVTGASRDSCGGVVYDMAHVSIAGG